jgi:hypothetical protein
MAICAVAALSACGTATPAEGTTSPATPTSTAAATTTPAAAAAAPPPTRAPQTRNWFDLDVGDCLTVLPRIDLGDVAVPVADCGTPHAAEVFLRAPVEVNAAIADVADHRCAAGLARYTGRSGNGAYSVTYLIDSNQDRTSNNPLPSTVICLLQSANGYPLTGSAATT